jgi:hypothetical protein
LFINLKTAKAFYPDRIAIAARAPTSSSNKMSPIGTTLPCRDVGDAVPPEEKWIGTVEALRVLEAVISMGITPL